MNNTIKASDYIYTQEVNEDALREAVEAVEDNNRINDGAWSDWDGAEHIRDAYDIDFAGDNPGLSQPTMDVVNRAITTDGESLNNDLPAISRSFQGHVFAGSFWDRDESNDER